MGPHLLSTALEYGVYAVKGSEVLFMLERGFS